MGIHDQETLRNLRSCEGGADEPHVALVASGRHPGHYFLDQVGIVVLGQTCAPCYYYYSAAISTYTLYTSCLCPQMYRGHFLSRQDHANFAPMFLPNKALPREPQVALIVAGRNPGLYFLGGRRVINEEIPDMSAWVHDSMC